MLTIWTFLFLLGKTIPYMDSTRKEKKVMAIYISSSFSLNMVSGNDFTLLRVRKVAPSDVPQDAVSVIGHIDIVRIVSSLLGREVAMNRTSISLNWDDTLYVVQYKGPRIPKGASHIPEGGTLEFFEVTAKPEGCTDCPSNECSMCGMIGWAHGV